jgi:GGDEF domain-containing protein
VAARILSALSEPFVIDGDGDGDRLFVHASLGVAVGPRENADALLRTADASMYEAKHQGKGRYVVANA